MSITSILDRFKGFARWSRTLDVPEGERMDGPITEVFRAEQAVIFMIDSNGAVRQLVGCTISGGDANLIHRGRTEVLRVLDYFDVQDHDLSKLDTGQDT